MGYRLFGIEMQSPFIIGSGPLSYGAPGLIRLHQAGAGAVVTKTINLVAAENAVTHMASCGMNTLINCEKWSDYGPERWITNDIPQSKTAGVVVIASVGVSLCAQPELVTRMIEAGADMIELVSYDETELKTMAETLRPYCTVPMLAKLSANYRDMLEVAGACRKAGCDGFTACDSIGPVMKIDIETGRPVLGGKDGKGWLSGAMIKPIILQKIVELRQKFDCPIIGLGGITTWQDAIEFTMAGADALGICTAPILMGVETIGKLNKGVERYLADRGYDGLDAIRGITLSRLPEQELMDSFHMGFQKENCIGCGRCVTVCAYGVRALDEDGNMTVDEAACRSCGLCVSVCPKSCITVNRGLISC